MLSLGKYDGGREGSNKELPNFQGLVGMSYLHNPFINMIEYTLRLHSDEIGHYNNVCFEACAAVVLIFQGCLLNSSRFSHCISASEENQHLDFMPVSYQDPYCYC